VTLRTIPPEDPHIFEEGRFRGSDSRPVTHWGMERVPTPMAAPGKYQARLTVDGKTYTQPVTILMDPKCPGTQADLESSVKLQLRISSDISKVADMINTIEWMRKQLADVEKMFAANPADKQRAEDARQMDQKMQDVENEMISEPLRASDDKTYISAWKIYYNLLWLNGEIGSGAGDVAGGTDFRPTDIEVKLTEQFEQKLRQAKEDYHTLMTKQLTAFNNTLREDNVMPIASAPAPERNQSE
ncbi:MAG TPA: hypothetical protein VFR08_09570, partial [Candidatus Angelobacter sp.]|nr:hypothetical protein [Candidatus Angelobacter sp.]